MLDGDEIISISFDNDLGLMSTEQGYDVFKYVEQLVIRKAIPMPNIYIHTANPAAARQMELAAKRLQELMSE